eukprot:m.192871 g.192871  ORF g.192871 m.192871 type:complete len:400 (+) comp18763_c0_seq1:214-1413(+)
MASSSSRRHSEHRPKRARLLDSDRTLPGQDSDASSAVVPATQGATETSAATSEEKSGVFLTTPVGHRTYRPPKSVVRGICRPIYDFLKHGRVGEGTYGIVYRAKDGVNNNTVAVKRIKMKNETGGMPVSSIREIALLRRARGHINIVNLIDVVVGRSLDAVFLTMEYCEHDLAALVDNMVVPFLDGQAKCLTLQLLEGVEWLHSLSIVHRDIKMSNLLLNNLGILKIADFGMARTVGTQEDGRSVRGGDLSPVVVTLWYRAPEVLFGDLSYGVAVDVWAVGCVLGELLKHQPLLPGKSEEHQVELLVNMFGKPHDGIWPQFSSLSLSSEYRLPDQKYDNVKTHFSFLDDDGIDLLHRLFVYDPTQRITAAAARLHPYFTTPPLPVRPEDMPTFPQIRPN